MRAVTFAIAMSFAILLGAPHEARAQSLQESLVAQLVEQGYEEITTRRTWLGRIRITGENEEFYREIVINPTTSLILRDYLRRKVLVGEEFELRNPYKDDDDDEGDGHDDEDGEEDHDNDEDDDRNDDDDDDDEDDDGDDDDGDDGDED